MCRSVQYRSLRRRTTCCFLIGISRLSAHTSSVLPRLRAHDARLDRDGDGGNRDPRQACCGRNARAEGDRAPTGIEPRLKSATSSRSSAWAASSGVRRPGRRSRNHRRTRIRPCEDLDGLRRPDARRHGIAVALDVQQGWQARRRASGNGPSVGSAEGQRVLRDVNYRPAGGPGA